ncbi:MAG: methyltransferase domain-containing protein, partial [Proteobacteria bacterium]|nr:methyltransferase domain-containing protein [Pseudomonadota bacterium]
MSEILNPVAERAARQNIIDEKNFEPTWRQNVDIPMIEMCFGCGMPKSPIILMPELRFKTFLINLTECMPTTGKIMIVSNANTQFELFRASVRKNVQNLYFSAQEVSALNYADNIFDDVLTQMSLYSTTRAEVILAGYRRVMKPGAYLICCMPQLGTFQAFFDFLEECLFAMNPKIGRSIM